MFVQCLDQSSRALGPSGQAELVSSSDVFPQLCNREERQTMQYSREHARADPGVTQGTVAAAAARVAGRRRRRGMSDDSQ